MLFLVRLKPLQWKGLRKLIYSKSFCAVQNEYMYNVEDEYSKVPNYPPIEPVDPDYLESKKMKQWYDKIKRQKTVEEKIFEVNVPRYWGWKCLLLKEGEIPFNSLDFTKSITRTHVIETDDLPDLSRNSSGEGFHLSDGFTNEIKNVILDNCERKRNNLLLENDKINYEKEFTRELVNELNRTILKFLSRDSKNLSTIQIDYSPRMESFWNLGSLTETYIPEEYPHGIKEPIPEEYEGRPSDKYIQYIGKPLIQLRSETPLPPLIPASQSLFLEYPVPKYNYDPFFVLGYEVVRRHVTNIPGFWPGEPREFSFLSYHDTNHLKHRPATYGFEDMLEAIKSQAILASFSWLMALSSYQGFSTFHDITYPFVTQTILTDGQFFSFATYQLNTTELHHKDHLYNSKSNMCWITPRMKLYDVEDEEVKNWNEDVMKMLLQMYSSQPEALEKCERKPYLGKDIKTVSQYEDVEKRCWLERNFKHFSSNRPRHRLDKMYEPTDYERIYKIQFRRIVRDPRRRPFELRENPYLRKMSDHCGEYIPRAERPDANLPKYKQRKFKKTFYPE